MTRVTWLTAAVLLLSLSLVLPALSAAQPPRGEYRCEWVGNSFSGDGGPNGEGQWVQNGADETEVTPDGTIVAGVSCDAAGRCIGLYRNGRVNRILLRGKPGRETAWGWNTGNNAVAVADGNVYVANTGKRLLRFTWTPGDIESARYVDEVELPVEPIGLAASPDRVVVVEKGGSLEVRRASDLEPTDRFDTTSATDAAFSPDGSLWIIAGRRITRLAFGIEAPGPSFQVAGDPSAIAFDPTGRLVLCDDGPHQQVLMYEVAPEPRLVQTFGTERGLSAGVPGVMEPRKLFALRGANYDASGRLHVAMSFGSGPAGNLFLRTFGPAGTLEHELFSTAFVDTFGFDPDADGTVVYSRTARFELDLDREVRGGVVKAVTIDHVGDPLDPRLTRGGSVLLRRVGGRRLLFIIGQHAGGYENYGFDGPDGQLARRVGRIHADDRWAWDVDDAATLWQGDGPDRTILRFPIQRWDGDRPVYDGQRPEHEPWPAGWQLIRRIQYDRVLDRLYLTGYLDGQCVETGGVAGATARCYDGWLAGRKELRWSVDLPRNANADPKRGPLTPASIDVAGDYLFCGLVRPTNGRQLVHALRVADGRLAATFEPKAPAGTTVGWLDMPYSIQALKRRNGEYLILVEENWRGKNLLYRWKPD